MLRKSGLFLFALFVYVFFLVVPSEFLFPLRCLCATIRYPPGSGEAFVEGNVRNTENAGVDGTKKGRRRKEHKQKVLVYEKTDDGNNVLKKLQSIIKNENVRKQVKESEVKARSMHTKKARQADKMEDAKTISKSLAEKIGDFDQFVSAIRKSLRDLYKDEFEYTEIKNDDDTKAVLVVNLVDVLHSIYEDIENGFNMTDDDIMRRVLRMDMELDDEQFSKLRGGLIPPPSDQSDNSNPGVSALQAENEGGSNNKAAVLNCAASDQECDLRQGPCLTNIPVEDQGRCGSCWAFASTHGASLNECYRTGKYTTYSEQEIIDCSDMECSGGWPHTLAKWLEYSNHLSDDADYPYVGKKEICNAKIKPNSYSGVISNSAAIVNAVKLNYSNIEGFVKAVKETIINHGYGLMYINSADMRVTGKTPQHLCSSNTYDHLVVLVGWALYQGQQYWIYRNSWGNNWGVEGYGYAYMYPNCGGQQKYPFWTIETLNFQQWKTTPNDNSKVPPVAHRYVGDVYSADRTARLSCSNKLDIVTALYTHWGTYFSRCGDNVLSSVQGTCQGKQSCSILVSPTVRCSDQLSYSYNCVDSFDTTTPAPVTTTTLAPVTTTTLSPATTTTTIGQSTTVSKNTEYESICSSKQKTQVNTM